ncbi:MAG: hypothetical protein CSA96_09855 [Bacteroidetes bacterium]|nr:MAG: hypothetical protein CSA96_09855 [Bacteroidota bacterium]
MKDFRADLFIAFLGYEARCTHVARKVEGIACRKIALTSAGHISEFSYALNKAYYLKQGFEIVPVRGEVPDLEPFLPADSSGKLNILFDCTGMSQRWYYELFRWLSVLEGYEKVMLRFTYSVAEYTAPASAPKVKRIQDFLSSETKKKKLKEALILGLGHEENIARSITRMIKPDLQYLFYTDPAIDVQYVQKVLVNNHEIISDTPIRNLIAYPIRNGQSIYKSLIEIILPLRNEYALTLIPQGPKIFSVAAMLVHLSYPDVRISYPVYHKKLALEKHASGEPVLLDISFETDE